MVSINKLRRPSALAVAAMLLFVSAVPLLSSKKANAALLLNRSIRMSSSAVGTSTDGQNVIYRVEFTVDNAAANLGGVVIDFCGNSPIVGDACTAPAGFNTNHTGLSLANQTNISGYSVSTVNSTSNTVIITNGTPAAPAGATVSFELGDGTTGNGFTNPSAVNATFYARIYTYATQAAALAHVPNAPTGYTDAGGIALSTAAQITITAKVQEKLTFCVYTAADCATGGTSVLLGDSNGVLDETDEFVDKNTKFDVSTNAAGNVAIRVKGNTLRTGPFDIAAVGGIPTRTVEGTEQFGFCSFASSGSGLTISFKYDGNGDATVGGGTGDCAGGTTQTAGTNTAGGAGNSTAYVATDPYFAFDLAAVNTTYGEQFATKAAGSLSQGTLAFIGNISPTTEAGIYTTILTFIATGTY